MDDSIKSTQIGKAIDDPNSSLPSEEKSSVPTQTVVANSSVKPENQVDIASFVVPVFPPISFLSRILVFLPEVPLFQSFLKNILNQEKYSRIDI